MPGRRTLRMLYFVTESGAAPRTPSARAVPIIASVRSVGAWLSLVEHLVRDQGVGGSNPLAPTNYPSPAEERMGGLLKPGFGLSGMFDAGQSVPAVDSRFRAAHSDAIATVPHSLRQSGENASVPMG
jgi:hypothetical protein